MDRHACVALCPHHHNNHHHHLSPFLSPSRNHTHTPSLPLLMRCIPYFRSCESAVCVNGCSFAIQCSCACQCLLPFCTSSRFGKFMSVNSLGFVTLLVTVQALCSLTSQVLEFYRLDEIIVPHQISCPRNSLHCTSFKMFCNTVLLSGCPTVSSRLRAAFLQRSITVGWDKCLPCLHIGDGVAGFLQSTLNASCCCC